MNIKRILLFFVCASMLFLSSCSFSDIVGSESYDFSAESVIGSATNDEAVIAELSNIIRALSVNSIFLTEFSGTLDATSKFADSLMMHLLTTNYSRFSGNTETLKKAAKEYPHLNISSAIPAGDFEGALYKYFNHGGNIRHKDTKLFRYLSKIRAYVPSTATASSSFSVDIVSIDETSSTYRMTFYCSAEDQTSPAYYAVFVKRASSGCYIQSLRQIASEKVSYKLPEAFS